MTAPDQDRYSKAEWDRAIQKMLAAWNRQGKNARRKRGATVVRTDKGKS